MKLRWYHVLLTVAMVLAFACGLMAQEAAKTDLRNRSQDIANTLSAFIRSLRFRGAVLQDRIEPVLKTRPPAADSK